MLPETKLHETKTELPGDTPQVATFFSVDKWDLLCENGGAPNIADRLKNISKPLKVVPLGLDHNQVMVSMICGLFCG